MNSENSHRIIYKTCVFCGERFPCTRIDATTCSASCRAKLHRWRKKLPKTVADARAQIQEVATYLDYEVSRATAVEYLNSLVAETRAVMESRGIRFVR